MQARFSARWIPRIFLEEFYHRQKADKPQYEFEAINVLASHEPRLNHWRCRLTCPAVQYNDRHIPLSIFTAEARTKNAAKQAVAAKAWDAIRESNVLVMAPGPRVAPPRYVGSANPIAMSPHLYPWSMRMLDQFRALWGMGEQLDFEVTLNSKYNKGSADVPTWRCRLTLPAVQLIEGSFPVSLEAATLITNAGTREAALDAAGAAALRILGQPSRSPQPSP